MKSPGIHFSLCVRARSRVTWKRSHLLTLQRNILLFPPLTKPSTGKLLAKWALPGHGTTCCPLQFTYPKVTHNSDVKPSWCLNHRLMTVLWAFFWKHIRGMIQEKPKTHPKMRCLEKYKQGREEMFSDGRFICNRRRYVCGDPSKKCYPAADRRTGFNPCAVCPDTGSPH